MKEELRKRIKEAAEKYADDYVVGDAAIIVDLLHKVARESFLAGAEYGYKEAVVMAKEWLKENVSSYACSYIVGCSKGEFITGFETDMNKLLEEKQNAQR